MKKPKPIKRTLSLFAFALLLFMPIIAYAQDNALVDTITGQIMPSGITAPMSKWEKFLDNLELLGLNIGFFALFVIFLALLTAYIWIPLQLYPMFKKYQKMLSQLLNFNFIKWG